MPDVIMRLPATMREYPIMIRGKLTHSLIIMASSLCLLTVAAFCRGIAQAADTYSNPVLVEVFPMTGLKANKSSLPPMHELVGLGDPAVILHDDRYYLYATGDNRSYDVYRSSDLVLWSKGPKVFRSAEHGVWSPDVFYSAKDRTFYLYYTVNKRIGVAISDQPDGSFTDRGALIKNAIDAHLFMDDDGTYYLYYAEYPAFRISVQPMESPVRKRGGPVHLIQPTEPWEKKGHPVTEAPWILKHEGTYYLLYSGGGADTADYAIGYATAKSPVGPFTKFPGNPIVKRGAGVFGPGHCSIIKDRSGNLWMVYHQKTDDVKGWNRIICIDPLWFDEHGILHGRATRATPEPAPETKAGRRHQQ
jgi:beta-xylosidase